MRKTLLTLLVALPISVMSIQAAVAGNASTAKEKLEAQWNGEPGPQVSYVNGMKAHWDADACGTLNGRQFDPTKCDGKEEVAISSKKEATIHQSTSKQSLADMPFDPMKCEQYYDALQSKG